MNIRHLFVASFFVLAGCLSLPVLAVSVYQWVDPEGVTHFSDETPARDNKSEQVSQYTIEENFPENRNPDEDYFSIVNQWKRTSDEREARLKSQRERQAARRVDVPQQTQVLVQEPQRVYSGYLPSPYFYNQGRLHQRSRFLNQPNQQAVQPAQPLPGYVGNVAPQK